MLTTPSRLFKLIIPLTTADKGHDKGNWRFNKHDFDIDMADVASRD
jgi:hypothetical protein